MNNFEQFKVNVPVGKKGKWEIKRFEVPAFSSAGYGRGVPKGTYTGLYRDSMLIMSDTPDEIQDHLDFIEKAKGNVLVVGLGIGMVLNALCSSSKVDKVTVVEKSRDVISLVANHYTALYGNKVEIINADIFNYRLQKNQFWDCAWFDIWDNLCTDNLKEMDKLSRKFSRYTNWSSCWGRDVIEKMQAEFDSWAC